MFRGYGDQDPTHCDSGEVYVVEGWSVWVLEQGGGPDVPGLTRRAEFEGPGEVVGLEAGQAVGEYSRVE